MSPIELIVAICIATLGSTGLFTFIQYLITRKDAKGDKFIDVQNDIAELKKCTIEVRDHIDTIQKDFRQDMESLNNKIDRNEAIQARIRILRANDEMRRNVHHSYEYFRQLHQDITAYEIYCSSHPEFRNNEAINSIQYINDVYQECLKEHSFLE